MYYLTLVLFFHYDKQKITSWRSVIKGIVFDSYIWVIPEYCILEKKGKLMQGTNQKPYIHIKESIYNDKFSYGLNNKILISELAELWFLDIKNIMRPSSYALYQSYAKKYILPYIGAMSADRFNADVLSELLGRLCKSNADSERKETALSQYTVYLLESMVHSMFHYGAEQKLIPEIPFGKAEFITVKKKEAMPLPELEVQKLLYTIEKQGKDLQLQILLPLYTGITLSELCGLKWEDINTDTGEIHIHRNLVRIQSNISKGSEEDTGTATSMAECELPESMCRKFVMPEKLSSLLKKVKCAKKPDKKSYVAEPDKKAGRKRSAGMPEDTPDGRTLQYRLKVAGEKAGIKGLTFKMLRDTFAVICLQAGGDVYSLAYIVGAGVSAVCDRYGEWMVRDDRFLQKLGTIISL